MGVGATPEEDPQRGVRLRVAALLCLAGIGLVLRWQPDGQAPEPCPAPALRDGLLVCDGEGAPAGGRAWLAGAPLDVNSATTLDLERIPGVGPALARRIVEARDERGGFSSFAELDEVRGIGDKTLLRLRPLLTVVPRSAIARPTIPGLASPRPATAGAHPVEPAAAPTDEALEPPR